MQVYLQREVGAARGGGSAFLAFCAFDDVQLKWLPGPVLHVTYPAETVVQQQLGEHFFSGGIIPVVYQARE